MEKRGRVRDEEVRDKNWEVRGREARSVFCLYA